MRKAYSYLFEGHPVPVFLAQTNGKSIWGYREKLKVSHYMAWRGALAMDNGTSPRPSRTSRGIEVDKTTEHHAGGPLALKEPSESGYNHDRLAHSMKTKLSTNSAFAYQI